MGRRTDSQRYGGQGGTDEDVGEQVWPACADQRRRLTLPAVIIGRALEPDVNNSVRILLSRV